MSDETPQTGEVISGEMFVVKSVGLGLLLVVASLAGIAIYLGASLVVSIIDVPLTHADGTITMWAFPVLGLSVGSWLIILGLSWAAIAHAFGIRRES